MEDKVVYVIHAADKADNDPFALDSYAVADSYELAEKIAKKDEEDGQIFSGWSIARFHLNSGTTV